MNETISYLGKFTIPATLIEIEGVAVESPAAMSSFGPMTALPYARLFAEDIEAIAQRVAELVRADSLAAIEARPWRAV